MPLTDLITPDAVFAALRVNSKKQVLQELATKAASLTGKPERDIFDSLMQREKLGTTGVGDGIALPHAKLPKLEKVYGVFARLDKPIDYDSLDGTPVDLVFLLLAPDGSGAEHLKALARVSRILRDAPTVDKLRATRDASAIYALLSAA
jgi:PTS system nitrogen regulatory IIA component